MARHGRLCAVAALAIVVSSGCGARQNAAGDTSTRLTVTTTEASTPASPSAPSSAPASPASPTTVTGGESSPPAQENRCTAGMLTGLVEPQNASAGNRYAVLVVRNKSQRLCTLWGYGGLDLLDAGKEVLPTQAERTLGPVPTLVRLRPGAAAGKILHWGVVATGDEPTDGPCQPAASSINVIPPDETAPFEVDFEFGPVCDQGRIETSAYFPR
ncbi:DUF4232 domain-containing protein [Actinophytocola glycyrrhizae]|uniref:DUF4232 domain-containing protein n=1 Tax=Actinophytocola glycyrrhizae TaxID=2044873 RepID=A0ABV9S180_9PSEU